MKSVWVLFVITLALAMGTSGAFACRTTSDQRVMVFYDIPPNMDATSIVLDVIFLDAPENSYLRQEAQVRDILRGSFSGDRVIVYRDNVSSCDVIPRPGARGFIIGHNVRMPDGAVVFEPVFESLGARFARGGRDQR